MKIVNRLMHVVFALWTVFWLLTILGSWDDFKFEMTRTITPDDMIVQDTALIIVSFVALLIVWGILRYIIGPASASAAPPTPAVATPAKAQPSNRPPWGWIITTVLIVIGLAIFYASLL